MGKRVNTAVWLEKEKRWRISVQKDGVRKVFSSSKPGRTGQREANAKADAWLDENIANGATKTTVLLDEFIETLKKRTIDSKHVKEEYLINSFVRPAIGHKKIESVTERDLQNIIDSAYANGRIDQKTKKRNPDNKLAKKSLNELRTTITAFTRFCRISKYTTLFPESLTIPDGARSVQKKILQPQDFAKLFSCNTTTLRGETVDEPYVYSWRFAVLTGLRPGELKGLTWEDIHDRYIHVQRSINIRGDITKGKNENAVRSIYMTQAAFDVLQEYKQLWEDELTGTIFPIDCHVTYYKRWKAYCESNGITPTSLYELRHTFVSAVKLLPQGIIKPIVGHSQSMDTFGVYSHYIEGEDLEAANAIDKIFEKLLPKETE